MRTTREHRGETSGGNPRPRLASSQGRSVGLLLAMASLIFGGCASRGGTDSTQSDSSGGEDPNFITAPGLDAGQVGALWDVATNKCYDFGYTVSNSDRATKNLVCTTQSGGHTLTLRVRFTDAGVFVGLQSSSASWALLGMKLGPKTREHMDMKAALSAAIAKFPTSTPVAPAPQAVPMQTAVVAQPSSQSATEPPATSAGAQASTAAEPMSVAELQRRLAALGYQPGPADGAMGRRTVDALRKFQGDQKLPVTGKIDPSTTVRLRSLK